MHTVDIKHPSQTTVTAVISTLFLTTQPRVEKKKHSDSQIKACLQQSAPVGNSNCYYGVKVSTHTRCVPGSAPLTGDKPIVCWSCES